MLSVDEDVNQLAMDAVGEMATDAVYSVSAKSALDEAARAVLDRQYRVCDAVKEFNVKDSTLRSRVDAEKRRREGVLPKKRGRKKALEEEEIVELTGEVIASDLACDSKDTAEICEMIETKRQKIDPDAQPLGESTKRKIAAAIAPKVVNNPHVKNSRRCEALSDEFGNISHAVMTSAILDNRTIPMGLIFNVDAVTSLIGGSSKSRVRIAASSAEELKSCNRSPSKKEDTTKQRGVKQFYLTSADGQLRCAVILLKDTHFKSIEICHLDNRGSGGYELYMVTVPNVKRGDKRSSSAAAAAAGRSADQQPAALPVEQEEETADDSNFNDNGNEGGAEEEGNEETFTNTAEDDLNHADGGDASTGESSSATPATASQDVQIMRDIFIKALLPSMRAKRNQLDVDLEDALSMFSIGAKKPDRPPDAETESMLLISDGDFPQIEATFSEVLPSITDQWIELNKLPGGGSLQFQPNDLMLAHKIIHQYVKTKAFKKKELFPEPSYLAKVEDVLKASKVDKPSRECFLNFFRQLPAILAKAFTPTKVHDGWVLAGLAPFHNVETILAQGATWKALEESSKELVRHAVKLLIPKAAQSGICTDADIVEALGEASNTVTTPITNMTFRTINQQRSLWLNQQGVLEMRQQAKEEAERKRQQAEDKINKQRRKEEQRKQDEAHSTRANTIQPRRGRFEQHGLTAAYRCFNTCGLKCAEHTAERWIGCAFCNTWACHKAPCVKKLRSHMAHNHDVTDVPIDAAAEP